MKIQSSALQALKFAMGLSEQSATVFLRRWLAGRWNEVYGPWPEFVEFCASNPDEPTFVAPDGTVRKLHYGAPGQEQPWDCWVRRGWAAQGAAANVIKYLRRTKDPEDIDDAKWYFRELMKLAEAGTELDPDFAVARSLLKELTREEMDVLGIPSCFKLKE